MVSRLCGVRKAARIQLRRIYLNREEEPFTLVSLTISVEVMDPPCYCQGIGNVILTQK